MKKYIILFGAPASGKGTQVEILSKKLGLPLLSPGALLRLEIEKKSELGKMIEPLVDQGKLISDSIVEAIVAKKLKDPSTARGVIFDGYPRNLMQQQFLIKELDLSPDDLIYAIYIDVTEENIMNRLSGRRACLCGETYHVLIKPPKKEGICDVCGRDLFIRDDDKPEVIRERLKVYYKEIDDMLGYWRQSGKLIEINGNRSIEEMGKEIGEELRKREMI